MAHSEMKKPAGQRLKLKQVAKGIWEVEGAYSGAYDFFENSQLYDLRRQSGRVANQAKFAQTEEES